MLKENFTNAQNALLLLFTCLVSKYTRELILEKDLTNAQYALNLL
jgi:hypothetical protein